MNVLCHNQSEENLPMMFGTKRKTFSEYVCAVARSTACLASTISMDARRRRVFAMILMVQKLGGENCTQSCCSNLTRE